MKKWYKVEAPNKIKVSVTQGVVPIFFQHGKFVELDEDFAKQFPDIFIPVEDSKKEGLSGATYTK